MHQPPHEGRLLMLYFSMLVVQVASPLCGAEPSVKPPITAVAFAPDGKSVIAVSQIGVQVFSWPELTHQHTTETSFSNLHCAAFSPHGNRLAVGGGNPSENGVVEIFAWPQGNLMTTIGEHDDSVTSIAWLNNAQFFSSSRDHQVRLCDVEMGTSHRSFQGHSRGVSSLCLLTDQTTLVTAGDDHSLRVWDTTAGELIRSLNQHTQPIHAVSVRPTAETLSMVASAAGDRTIRFWQPTIGRMVRYARLEAEPLDIAWNNTGTQIVAACADGHVRVVDPIEVTVTQVLVGIDGWAYAIAIHPTDGDAVIGGTNGIVRRIELTEEPARSPTPR